MSLPLKGTSVTSDPKGTFALRSLAFLWNRLITCKIFIQPQITKEYPLHTSVNESETTIMCASKL